MSDFPSTWGNYLIKGIVETSAPEVVSLWPQTLGWKIVSLILLFYLSKILYQAWLSYKRNSYRREALTWLQNLPTYFNLAEQPVYRQLPSLIRKTALEAFGRDQVSQLSNEQWDRWLDDQCELTCFEEKCARYLHVLAYTQIPRLNEDQINTLVTQIELWIKHHRRQHD